MGYPGRIDLVIVGLADRFDKTIYADRLISGKSVLHAK